MRIPIDLGEMHGHELITLARKCVRASNDRREIKFKIVMID